MRKTIFQFFHWYYPKNKLWKDVSQQAEHLEWLGISDVWLPPAYKSSAGSNGVGYDVYDLFDLGEFDQKGSVKTKYGTKNQLINSIKTLHQHNLNAMADIVLNHKNGADETETATVIKVDYNDRNKIVSEAFEKEINTKYYFPGRNKKYSEFVWDWHAFTGVDECTSDEGNCIFKILNEHGGEAWDNVIGNEFGNFDYLLGADIEFRNPNVRNELKYWGKWFIETTAFDSLRLDAVKHISPDFYKEWLDYLNETFQKKFFTVAEYWSSDLHFLHEYLNVMEDRVQLFDVPLHHNLYDASMKGKDYNLPDIFNNTLVGTRSQSAVTFVDNHDTQPTQSLESFVDFWFKPHANALILLRQEGVPCVFHPSYYGGSYESNGNKIDLAPVPHLYKMLMIRKNLFDGQQCDYFDHPNVISWFVSGTLENRNAGFVVVLSNSDDGFKEMNLGSLNGNRKFVDVTGSFADAIQTNDEGIAIFPVKSRSISIWIKEEALDKIK
ncbi:MAG: alpha-amylase [Parafilimonas sp.]|nr:alpha-amylase [Parafilimonas sp.]